MMGLVAIIMLAMIVPVAHAENETSGSAGVDFMSSYVWRGIEIHEDIAIQPWVGITYGGFGANMWADYDSDPAVQEGIETDLTLNYVFSVGKFGFDAGYIYYMLDGFADTQELYVSAGYDILLSPSLAFYLDIDEGNGAFIVASIGHTFSFMNDKAGINLGASASYNIGNEVMGVDDGGDDFSDLYNGELSASVSYAVTDAISVEPKIAYTFPLSEDADNAIEALSENGESKHVYGGVGVSLSF